MRKNKLKKVKNVALCFSGMAKSLELCYPYLKKNLLDHIGSYDIFCYAEDDKDLKKVKLLNPVRIKKVKSSEVDEIIKDELRYLNKQNYKTIIFPESFRFNLRNIYQQLFKIKKSFELLEEYMDEENISYKYFIRIRFDMLPLDVFNLKNFEIKKNEVIVPKMKSYHSKDSFNDMFCITKDFDAFRSYCSLYNNFGSVVQKSISVKITFFQRLYFFFERNYNNFFLFILKELNTKQRKLPRKILGCMLLFTKMFYKEFKIKNNICGPDKAFFYHLKSEKKIIKEEKINFIIVRSLDEGFLIFG